MLNLNEYTRFKVINNIVFGGAGFLGSHLVDKLLDNDENVFCIDNLSSGDLYNLKHLKYNKKFIFINHDILNPLVSEIPIEKIWHLACPASPNIYQSDPLKTIRVNYEGTFNILNLAKLFKSKMLFTSTSEVYGITNKNPQKENMPITLSTYSPRACYSEGKRIAETLINSFRETNKMDIKIARIFNTYGPRLNLSDGRVIGNFIKQCSKEDKLTIYGNGTQTRSFCYVSDLIEGLIKLMDSNFIYPINLGNEEEITIIKLAKLIQTKIKREVKLEYLNLPLDDPKKRKPCLDNAKKYLKWNPKVSLSDGLNETINYFI
ncbi:MAG: GDP-mannose 4,6-dehydratase [Prochlorococcus marinus CUG1438]|nr:GDP-mannose 4,6-dehydratase [Prochlorococcus marinus CUG1438]